MIRRMASAPRPSAISSAQNGVNCVCQILSGTLSSILRIPQATPAMPSDCSSPASPRGIGLLVLTISITFSTNPSARPRIGLLDGRWINLEFRRVPCLARACFHAATWKSFNETIESSAKVFSLEHAIISWLPRAAG